MPRVSRIEFDTFNCERFLRQKLFFNLRKNVDSLSYVDFAFSINFSLFMFYFFVNFRRFIFYFLINFGRFIF